MAVTRRGFLARTAGVAAGLAAPVAPVAARATEAEAPPPLAVIALHRLAYGPRPGDIQQFNTLGLAGWVDWQLTMSEAEDTECAAKLAEARIKITYDAASNGSYGAKNEARPLELLNQTTAQLWPRGDYSKTYPWAERVRGFDEVRVATWYRARFSKRQLFEVLVDFWHNHFNINAGNEPVIASTFPVYDRDVIRKNTLGNFRTFLEDVATSTAMLYYLDNYNNLAAGAEGGNENYSRELFELHTFGSDNYYKFDEAIGTISYGGTTYPAGYLDEDVYQTSYCLTGWGVDKTNGTFLFNNNNHQPGLKRVLGVDIMSSTDGRKEGQKVFDLLAGHPLVARHVIGKLCRRLISDDISSLTSLIDEAVDVWMQNLAAADQLKQVVRVLVLSDAFQNTWGAKVKRPFEAMMAFLRATEAQLPVDQAAVNGDTGAGNYWNSLFWYYNGTGHRLFEWPTPTGHPDLAEYWVSTNSTLRRWNLPYILTQIWGGNVAIPSITDWNPDNELRTVTQIVDDWIARLFGYSIDPAIRSHVITFFAYGGDANAKPQPTTREPDWGKNDSLKQRYQAMIQLLAASPQFHNR